MSSTSTTAPGRGRHGPGRPGTPRRLRRRVDCAARPRYPVDGQIVSLPEWTEESESDRPSRLILSTGWLDNPATGRAYSAAAHIYGDIYCLQAGYCQPDQSGPEIFAGLRDQAVNASHAFEALLEKDAKRAPSRGRKR